MAEQYRGNWRKGHSKGFVSQAKTTVSAGTIQLQLRNNIAIYTLKSRQDRPLLSPKWTLYTL
jgi:hypothetical protein